MPDRMIFPNLAVQDLDRSVAFFRSLGFAFDERMTDETATAMIVNEHAMVMLLLESRFADFVTKPISNPNEQTESIIAFSAESREEVDELADKALANGGSTAMDPLDMGFMYSRSFRDPDGHHWEVVWMDPAALEGQPAESGATA
jgi:predicted lactoylglutathione lyase